MQVRRRTTDTRAASNRLQPCRAQLARNFTYDVAGNLTSNGNVTFTYDGRGRLTQASTGHKYWINGLGQRVAKTGPGVTSGANYYVYDEQGRLIGEYDAAGDDASGVDLPRRHAGGERAPEGGRRCRHLSDLQRSPRHATADHESANQVVWEWKTDTFGAGPANENPSGLGAFSFNLRFPGQYYDAETGLHYNYFRDYDPTIGRYRGE